MQLHTTSEAVQFTKVCFDQFLFQWNFVVKSLKAQYEKKLAKNIRPPDI